MIQIYYRGQLIGATTSQVKAVEIARKHAGKSMSPDELFNLQTNSKNKDYDFRS